VDFSHPYFIFFIHYRLIGQRWKNIDPDRLAKYSEMASEDTERYKDEMQSYNGRQEAKMRSEALKPPVAFNSGPPAGRGAEAYSAAEMARGGAVPGYPEQMANMSAFANPGVQAQMGAQGYNPYGGMDFSGYGGMGGMNAYAMGAYGNPYAGMGAQQEAAMGGGGGGGGMDQAAAYGRAGVGGGYGAQAAAMQNMQQQMMGGQFQGGMMGGYG
jgi:hypothetical protein